MTLLTVTNLAKSLGGHSILRSASFQLARGERLALVGANGAGKSTLLHCLAGSLEPDGGGIHWVHPGLKAAFLPQTPSFDAGRPLGEQLEVVESGLPGQSVQLGRSGQAVGLDPVLLRQLRLTDLLDRKAGALSGGEKTRAGLYRALASPFGGRPPALLLLDEPTNHLDMAGIDWLIGLLRGWEGALLVVSHDRYFLDQVTTRTLELADGTVTSYPGNWSVYRDLKAAERRRAAEEYRQYQVKKGQLVEAIRRERDWARAGHNAKKDPMGPANQKDFQRRQAQAHMRIAKSMEGRLERMRVAKPRDAARVNVIFGGEADSARHLVLAESMAFAYPGAKPLFQGADFWIERGERVAVVGANGAGKTTLVKLILGELTPTAGRLYRAPVRVGYLHQELADLNPALTVLAEAVAESRAPLSEVRNLLACLLFRGEEIQKRVGDLSGGERLRLAIAKLILAEPDLLVLDEPTNGLDLLTRERVEEALEAYGGTLLVVSHDRFLLERLGAAVLAVGGGGVVLARESFAAWTERQRAGVDVALAGRTAADGVTAGRRAAGGTGLPHGPKEGNSVPTALSMRERREGILLLEMRLARLGAQLAAAPPSEKEALEGEFIRLSRELRQLRG